VTDGEPRYATAAAFRRGVADRLRQQAAARGRPVLELRREFLFQRFLARVFADPTGPWILKGATGLLVRLPGARYSRDIDLLYPSQSPDLRGAVQELRGLARADIGDHLSFVIDDPMVQADGQTLATLGVTGYTGATRFDRFSVDLTTELHVVGSFERLRPEPVILVPGLTALPEFTLYPLPDQVADKLCAMYAEYGVPPGPSTRFRDLVDLVLIITTSSLDADLTARALRSEARRRNMTLPDRLRAPGPQWVAGYAQTARHSSLPADLRSLDPALARVEECLGPLLTGSHPGGHWDPQRRRWNAMR